MNGWPDWFGVDPSRVFAQAGTPGGAAPSRSRHPDRPQAAPPEAGPAVPPIISPPITSVPPAPQATQSGRRNVIVPDQQGGIYLGAFVADNPTEVDATYFDNIAGQNTDIILKFMAFSDLSFPTYEMNGLAQAGATPFIKLEPWAWSNNPSNPYTLERIGSGDFDVQLRQFAEGARQFGRPLFVSFAHEMNGSGWYPWQGDPEAFKQAWKHVVDIVNGVTANVTWVWCPNIDFGRLAEYYPGDEYADWVSLDGYSTRDFGSGIRTMAGLFDRDLAEMRRITHKPVMIGETGFDADTPEDDRVNHPQFLREMVNWLFERGVSAVIYFDTDKSDPGSGSVQHWTIEDPTNPSQVTPAMQAFREALAQRAAALARPVQTVSGMTGAPIPPGISPEGPQELTAPPPIQPRITPRIVLRESPDGSGVEVMEEQTKVRLFNFQSPANGKSTWERAQELAGALQKAQREQLFREKTLERVQTRRGWEIRIGDVTLFHLTPRDAQLEGTSWSELVNAFSRSLIDSQIVDAAAALQRRRQELEAYVYPRGINRLLAYPNFVQIGAEQKRELAKVYQALAHATHDMSYHQRAIATFVEVLKTKPDQSHHNPIYYFEILMDLATSFRDLAVLYDPRQSDPRALVRTFAVPLHSIETILACTESRQNTAACYEGRSPTPGPGVIHLADAQSLYQVPERIFRHIYQLPTIPLGYRARATREWGSTRYMELLMGRVPQEERARALQEIQFHYQTSLVLNQDQSHAELMAKPLEAIPSIQAMRRRMEQQPLYEAAHFQGVDFRRYESVGDAFVDSLSIDNLFHRFLGTALVSPKVLHEVAKAFVSLGDMFLLAARTNPDEWGQGTAQQLVAATHWYSNFTEGLQNLGEEREFRIYFVQGHQGSGEALIQLGDAGIRQGEMLFDQAAPQTEQKAQEIIQRGMNRVAQAVIHFAEASRYGEVLIASIQGDNPLAANSAGAFWTERDAYFRSRVSLQNGLLRAYYYIKQGRSERGNYIFSPQLEAELKEALLKLVKVRFQIEVDPSPERAKDEVKRYRQLSTLQLLARLAQDYDTRNTARLLEIPQKFVWLEARVNHAETQLRFPSSPTETAEESQARLQRVARQLDDVLGILQSPEFGAGYNYLRERATKLRSELVGQIGEGPGRDICIPGQPSVPCLRVLLNAKQSRPVIEMGQQLESRRLTNQERAEVYFHMALAHLDLLNKSEAKRRLRQALSLAGIRADQRIEIQSQLRNLEEEERLLRQGGR